jgi:hypothetical protein
VVHGSGSVSLDVWIIKTSRLKLTTVLQGRIGLKTGFFLLGYWLQLVKLTTVFHEQLDLRIWSLSLGYWFVQGLFGCWIYSSTG